MNKQLTCGGSSGGEGALIGARGSCIGLGTDLGGSVRIPAHFNGIYSLKPSGSRLPISDVRDGLEGQEGIP